MKIYVIIPAHNESEFIGKTLNSLVNQSLLPERIVVVDDQSSDNTPGIVQKFTEKYNFITLVRRSSSDIHLPGSKVVNAFYSGFETVDNDFDVICKFDADLIFPENYLKIIAEHFQADPQIGMAGGFCHILQNEKWVLENLTGKDHIRGALKAYRKECFRDIGGLKPSMGWDTVDELLAQYHNWKITTDNTLAVKHLRPTGFTYDKTAKLKQGEAFYKLRYGFLISFIASAKLAMNKKNPALAKDYLEGYFSAKQKQMPFLVSKREGLFIRKLRYKKMIARLF